ncbi:A/G-specific adenine glycosylase [Ferruginibacter sp. HRS2-29]|nr:A/G-specific adenine glycosylase [Ferruginibacter sp. HRS2-29]
MQKTNQLFFREQLLLWNRTENDRDMPWKGEKDPYKIWLSEIILQQTRVDQGLAYYKRFIKKYPDVKSLAEAEDQAVFKMWEGLGYYSRCRNLLASARSIASDSGGEFPDTYENILALKGVGAYTASAIASFAFGLPHAVVDGNVQRVLARFFGLEIPIDSTAGKKIFAELAQQLLDKHDPAGYNQAIMDFGATVCKPQLPLCVSCILKEKCDALATGNVASLPVKKKKLQKKDRWFYYVIAEYKTKIFVRERTGKDIWQSLHEFILMEEEREMPVEQVVKKRLPSIFGSTAYSVESVSQVYKQLLSHQTIRAVFIRVKLKALPVMPGYQSLAGIETGKLAFPRVINTYLEDEQRGNVQLSVF